MSRAVAVRIGVGGEVVAGHLLRSQIERLVDGAPAGAAALQKRCAVLPVQIGCGAFAHVAFRICATAFGAPSRQPFKRLLACEHALELPVLA